MVGIWMKSMVRAPRVCRIPDFGLCSVSKRIEGDFSNGDFTQLGFCIAAVSWTPDPSLKFTVTSVP